MVQVEAETPDMFLGLLREPRAPGSPLGPTHKAIMIEQFGRSIFGPWGKWWKTNRPMAHKTRFFTEEIESTTLEKVISDNTGAAVSGDAFKNGGSVTFQPHEPNPVAAVADGAAIAGVTVTDAEGPSSVAADAEAPGAAVTVASTTEDGEESTSDITVDTTLNGVPQDPAVPPTPEPQPEPQPEPTNSGASLNLGQTAAAA